jgi:TolB-like protein/DNA-binding winged helix-turn-helix (wHTH) protein/Tfp pilus assembly protein PilF
MVCMPAPASTSRRLVFGAYEADLLSGELRKHGKRVRLQSQPFQLLAMLLERPGDLVTREEICQKLWPADTFVDFDHSLGTAINKIREVLNDSAAEPRFVETVPRRGYRFIAPVTSVDPGSTVPPIRTTHKSKLLYALFGVCVALALFSAALIAGNFHGWRKGLLSKLSAQPPVMSIAVLPLLNLSNDPDQQFFADGMTDELITSLAQISSLRVISHTSAMAYLGTHKSAAEIARELGVDALVEGSVVRSGSKVRINAQLIHAASDRHLWAHSYDREMSDVLTVQGEVAREIAESISIRLTSREQAQLSRAHPVHPEVALLYFKGSYFLSQLDTPRAKEVFTEAIHLDPNSAESWAGLADTLHTMGVEGNYDAFAQAKEAANKALEIDSSQAQALMVLGIVSFLYDWNPTQSEAFFRRSIESRPSYAMAHALFSSMLAHQGRFEEAIEESKRATASDPASVLTNSMAWHPYFCARRYDDALRIMLSAVEADPTVGPVNWRLATTWEQKGEYRKAIEASSEEEGPLLRAALVSGGEQGYWQRKLEILLSGRDPSDRNDFTAIARCYMHLGKREEAIQSLEKGYKMHDRFLIFWLPIYEEFDPLRSDPRFQTMLHGLGIP